MGVTYGAYDFQMLQSTSRGYKELLIIQFNDQIVFIIPPTYSFSQI
jgi:hypothetical protein